MNIKEIIKKIPLIWKLLGGSALATALILFIFKLLIEQIIVDWHNRPKITSSPVSLTICHEIAEGWKVEFISNIYNEGNSEGIIKSIDIYLYFNNNEERPYRITKNLAFTIEGKSPLIDTCKGILPSDLEVTSDLSLHKLRYRLYRNNDKAWYECDIQQKDIKISYEPDPGSLNLNKIPFARFNKKEGLMHYAVKWHNIIYKGKTHQVAIYPPIAEMEYEIESDSIFLSISMPIGDTSLIIGSGVVTGQFITPLVWADFEIERFLVLPDYMNLGFEKVTRGKEEIASEEYYFELGRLGEYDYWVVYKF